MWKKYRLMAPDEAPAGGGSTASPAPASAPASSPSSAAPAASGVSNTPAAPASSDQPGTVVDNFDFGSLIDYASGVEEPAAPSVTPLSAPVAPASTPAAPQAAAPIAVPSQSSAPAAPTGQAAQPAAPATAQPPASTEQPAQPFDWEKHRQEFIPKLEKQYALSEQEVTDFQTNPGAVIPKLAAQLHYNVTMALQAAIKEFIPHAIGGEMQTQALRTRHEASFYSQHPKLKEAVEKDIKVESAINQCIASVRAANPRASMADVMKQSGLLAMITLGIDPTQSAAPAAAPAPVQPQTIPGRPAGTGAQGHMSPRAPGSSGTETEADLYANMADHFANGGG